MALLLVGTFLFLAMQGIDDYGYTSDFNNIPGINDGKILPEGVRIEEDLFFSRTGWLDDWCLYVIGKFTPEITSYLLGKPNEIGFPVPEISYEEETPIYLALWRLKNIPKDIEHNLKLTQRQENNKYYYSKIDDYLVLFYIKYKKHYHVKIYLLGKSGYFIMEVIHVT